MTESQIHKANSWLLFISIFSCIVIFFLGSDKAQSAPARQALGDEDLSRGRLAEYALALSPDPENRAVISDFLFPDNAADGIYGIDVSHYNGDLDWQSIPVTNVQFVYIKASQGVAFYDDKFAHNWSGLETLRKSNTSIRRGAYHFLAAKGKADDQVKNFIDTLTASGGIGKEDLPPVLDMEPDVIVCDGKVVTDDRGQPIDQWSNSTKADVAAKALRWLRLVEQKVGKRPIIYTNTSWWKDKIGENADFSQYTLWIADYRKSSITAGAPGLPRGFGKALWQFTDHGSISLGQNKNLLFDTTSFFGDRSLFDKLLGVVTQ